MDIKLTVTTQMQQTLIKQGMNHQSAKPTKATSNSSADSVLVSQYPKELEKYRETLNQEVGQLEERVQEVKRQLQEGSYRVDPEAIAKALLNHE